MDEKENRANDAENNASIKKKQSIFKKWWFWLIIAFLFIIIIIGFALSGNDATEDASANTSSDTSQSEGIQASKKEEDKNTLGDYKCVVKGAEISKDDLGNDIVIITYEFTNNSSESQSFDGAFQDEVYQDGVQLQASYFTSDTDSGFDSKIQPGKIKEVKKAYEISDTTKDLQIEITEWLSLSDDKIVEKVSLK